MSYSSMSLRLLASLAVMVLGCVFASTAQAENLRILEIAPDGFPNTRAAVLQETEDGLDPVTYHQLYETPSEYGAAQILWHSDHQSIVIDPQHVLAEGGYPMVLDATLPASSDLMYQAWSIDEERIVKRFTHFTSGPDWGINPDRLAMLPDGEYTLMVTLRIGYAPSAKASQRVSIRSGGVPTESLRPIPRPQRPDTTGRPQTPVGDKLEELEDIELGGRIIYVSPDGNNRNDGLSEARPVRDLNHAAALLRDGRGDWLLLERGAVFDLPSSRGGAFRYWRTSGASIDEPTVIGTYGPSDRPRPVIRSNGNSVFRSIRASNLVIRDLHLVANQRVDGRSSKGNEMGIAINSGDHIRIERVVVDSFKDNILMADYPSPPRGEHTITNVTLFGCEVKNAYSSSTHSQGLYAADVRGLDIVQCVFDHNGWRANSRAAERTGFNHNIYLSECDEVRVADNVVSRGSNMGLKLRSDYANGMEDVVVEGNLFIGNLTGMTASSDPNGETSTLTIRRLTVRNNVFTDHGGVIPGGAELGHAVILQQIGDGTVCDNLLIDLGNPINREAFNVGDRSPLNNIVIERNILERWRMSRGREPLTSDTNHRGVTLRDNLVEAGVATRSLADYAGDRGIYGLVDAIAAEQESCNDVVLWLFQGTQ